MNSVKITVFSLLICSGAFAFGQAAPASTATATGITQPSQRLKLSFAVQGIVKDVSVKEGDRVKSGQVLLSQDDRMERKQLEAMRLEADAPHGVDFAIADMKAKKIELARIERMHQSKVASDQEYEASKVAAELSEIKVRQAQMESGTKKLEASRQDIKIELMRLISPVDGIVEKLIVGPGEAVDPQKQDAACWVVKNNPLWVEIRDLPTAQAKALKLGQKLAVRYDDEQEWREAAIIFFAPVADAASDTQLVRLEMPNPTDRSTGLHVIVRLPEPVAAVENR